MTNKIRLLPAVIGALAPLAANAQVNIIHIMSDDHSYQTISAYGGELSKLAPTPNLDRLAAQGMIFRRAYVENSISSPSRATLLTGKYSHMHGKTTLGRKNKFDPEQMTFPAILHEAGYQTALFGKWHLDGLPNGFDEYSILNGQGTYYNPVMLSKGGDEYVRQDGYAAEIITDKAIDWLEHRDAGKPFCLLVHHKSVHRHWHPELKYLDLYDDVVFPEPPTLFDDYSTRTEAAHCQQMNILSSMDLITDSKIDQLIPPGNAGKKNEYFVEIGRLSPEEQEAFKSAYRDENEEFIAAGLKGNDLVSWKYQRYIRDYMRCVKSLDDQIGRLLDYLEENDMMSNTVIVYTSDQGFYMGEHGWFDKRFMYEESFRTPLIVCYPEHIAPGSVCDELVQNIDYAPTYLSLAGQKVPEEMCGKSLDPLFETGKSKCKWRDDLYYHYYDYPAIHNVRRHDGIMSKDYKLIHFKDNGGGDKGKDKSIDSWELYDLKKDPTEINNVFDDPSYRKIIKDLKKRLNKKREQLKISEYEKSNFADEPIVL